jgi:hypothetical protein
LEQPRTEPVGVPARPALHVKDPRSTIELVKDIAADTSSLVRKEVELAKQELVEAITARLKAAGAMAAAGVFGLFMLGFLALATAAALDVVFPAWLAALIVACGFALIAGPAILFGLRKMKAPPLAPEETVRTVKEDVEWARAQPKR